MDNADKATAEAPPVPRLDHVMVLLDPASYQAVTESGFLGGRFARRKVKHADSSVAGSYSTLGIAGDNTLIELFGTRPPGADILNGGLVFSFAQPGSSSLAQSLLGAAEVEHRYDLVRRAVPGHDEPQPWYHLINVDLGQPSPLLLFLNEVTPAYFASVGASAGADGTLDRAAYLRAVLGEHEGERPLMRDIESVTLAVTEQRAARLTAALRPFGFSAESGGVLRGPELTLRLVGGAEGAERVTEIGIRISAAGYEPGRALDFGPGCRLVFDSPEFARMVFPPVG